MKVLSINAGYFLGFDGTYRDYISNFGRSIKADSGVEKECLNLFTKLVETQDPDVVLLQEVDTGSFRSSLDNQIKFISENISGFNWVYECKYRGILFPRMPVMSSMSNSVGLSNGEVINHRLKCGRKNLVQEIVFDNLSLFSVHLSTFSRRTRRKQLLELKALTGNKNAVISGDFNFHNDDEIERAEKILNKKINSPGPTFPARNPDRKLDLVAYGENININDLSDLGEGFSDHRPISFNVAIR